MHDIGFHFHSKSEATCFKQISIDIVTVIMKVILNNHDYCPNKTVL